MVFIRTRYRGLFFYRLADKICGGLFAAREKAFSSSGKVFAIATGLQ
jgi:hypothetical protein